MQKQRVIFGVLTLFALFVPTLAAHAQSSAPAQKPDIESILTAKKVEMGADKKEVLTAKVKECQWHPEYMRIRAEQWIDGLKKKTFVRYF